MSHPSAHLKLRIAPASLNESKEEVEFAKIAKQFKKHKLFVTMKDTKPIRGKYPVWSTKGWKYVTSPKWTEPENALIRTLR